MRIGVFTEGGYEGKVPRNHPNMRTDLAWWCALDATHHPLPTLHEIPDNSYDFGIIIIPKKRKYLLDYPLVEHLRRICNKIATMQESTYYYWQDDPIVEQIWYYNLIMEIKRQIIRTKKYTTKEVISEFLDFWPLSIVTPAMILLILFVINAHTHTSTI